MSSLLMVSLQERESFAALRLYLLCCGHIAPLKEEGAFTSISKDLIRARLFWGAGERGHGSLRREEILSAELPEEPEGTLYVLPKLLLGQTYLVGEQCPVL